MASLLDRAKQVRDLMEESIPSLLKRAQKVKKHLGKDSDSDIESIPLEEREEIYKEIDQAVSANRLHIKEDTFVFLPESSDKRLPLIINGGALALTLILTAIFFFLFNRAETHLVSEPEIIHSAESALIDELKRESEEKIGEKQQEVNAIQGKLEEVKEQQRLLEENMASELARREAELRANFESELETERERLRREGFSEREIEEKINEYKAQRESQFESQLSELTTRLEEEQRAKENEIASLAASYEESLNQAIQERASLENSLKEQLESERDIALQEMAELDALKKQEDFIINQILSLYNKVNGSIQNKNYIEATEELDSLENYLNQDNVSSLDAVQYRREIDLFMINSLRKLILNEQERASATESFQEYTVDLERPGESEAEKTLELVSEMVNRGNSYFDEGNMEEARKSYLEAMSYVPVLDESFNRLQDMEEQDLARERELFSQSLKEGDSFYRSKDFNSAIGKYKQALEYLTLDSDKTGAMVDKLVEAGLSREAAAGNTLVSRDDLSLINEAKQQQKTREKLLGDLSEMEEKIQEAEPNDFNQQGSTDLVSLLGTKLLIKEVLASDSIREKYPDLHEKMGIYLEAYGREKEKSGRDAALKEIITITDQLSQKEKTSLTLSSSEKEQREMLLEFLQNLKSIIEGGN
jgi:hypothetical protein